MTSLISSRALCPQRTYTGFIVTRTLPATYVYGIYRHAHSARHVRIWDLSSRANLWNDSMRFRIIVYTHVTMATGSMKSIHHLFKSMHIACLPLMHPSDVTIAIIILQSKKTKYSEFEIVQVKIQIKTGTRPKAEIKMES